MTRDLAKYGIKATTYNANAVASRQTTAMQTAVASRQYAGIIWQPIAQQAAATSITAIQGAGMAQVVFTVERPAGLHVPVMLLNSAEALYGAGRAAAQYITSHHAFGGHVLAAFMNYYPPSPDCDNRFAGWVAGLKSADPQAKVVYNEGAPSTAAADTKFANFLTRHINFNVYDGCGASVGLGGIAAMQAAGIAGAANKVPQHVFITTEDATPPELQLLWSKNSAEMAATLLPPKEGAALAVGLMVKELTGKVKINSDATVKIHWPLITPNCQRDRKKMLAEFLGVAGFTVPGCSFKWTGSYTKP